MPGARCSSKTASLLLVLGMAARAAADPPGDPDAPPPPAPPGTPQPATAAPAVSSPPRPWMPQPALAPVFIAWPPPVDLQSTEPGVSLSVFARDAHPDRDPPLLTCSVPPCRVPLWPGRYKVHVSEGSATVAGARVFETRGPAAVTVDPDTTEHRDLGLVMGIAGPIVTLLGVGLALSCGPDCHRSTAERSRVGTGVLLMLGGLTITPVGWVMFGTSFKPEVEVRDNG